MRSETANSKIASHHDNRDIDARQQVGQIVVDLRKLRIPAHHLFIEGGQLLVGGLQLFFGGQKLFIGALKLLVARLNLFVGGLELFGGRLLFFDDRLQVQLRGAELLLELLQPARWWRRRSLAGLSALRFSRSVGGLRLFEEHYEVSLRSGPEFNGRYRNNHLPRSSPLAPLEKS